MAKIAIVGTTSWGTTLGVIQGEKGNSVTLWARTEEEAVELNKARENVVFLPGIKLPPQVGVTASAEEAMAGADIAILAIPAQSVRNNIKAISAFLGSSTLIMSAAKGLEVDSLLRPFGT